MENILLADIGCSYSNERSNPFYVFNIILYEKQMSKDLLLSIFQKVKEKGVIDDDLIKDLDNLFSDKSTSILEVIQRGFTKYTYTPSNKVVWGVRAQKPPDKEYFIYPKLYCSCHDFYKAVVVERKRSFCKHLLAQTISESLNSYKEVNLQDKEFARRVKDLNLDF